MLFALSACGTGSVRVRSVEVQNSTFFEDIYREGIRNDMELIKDGKNYKIGLSFTNGNYEEFKNQFLYRYDANFGLQLVIEIQNNTKEAITATGLHVDNNGYKATYVSAALGDCEEITVQPGETVQAIVYFLGNGSLFMNEEFINKIFPEMPMYLKYTTASGEQLKEEIRFKKVDIE